MPDDVEHATPSGVATTVVAATRPKRRVQLPVPKAHRRRTAVPADVCDACWDLSRGYSQKVGHTYKDTCTKPVPRKGKGEERESGSLPSWSPPFTTYKRGSSPTYTPLREARKPSYSCLILSTHAWRTLGQSCED